MHGMTESACHVCATPYKPGTTTCAFCGVSLVDPEPEPPAPQQAPSGTGADTGIAAEVAAETDAPADIAAAAEADAPADDASAARAGLEAASADATDADDAEPTAAADGPAEGVADTAETPGVPADSTEPETTGPARKRAPSFARGPSAADAARRRLQRIEWGVAGGLAALLLVQVVASDFDQLAASGATRPWLQRVCAVVRCTLPPWREPQALRMLQRDVRAIPDRPGLLRVSASFRNDALWAQPWPRLRIVLSDADGRAIAARDFAAREYLGANATANGIASGQVAGIAFDVVDPSPRVTAFTFEFR